MAGNEQPRAMGPAVRSKGGIVVVGAILVMLAFVAGVLLQRQFAIVRIRGAEQVAREISGIDDPVPPAPQWESWMYDGAKRQGQIEGTSTELMGELIRPKGHFGAFTTSDTFEQVAKFYAEQLRFENADTVAQSHQAVLSEGNAGAEANYLLDDTADVSEPGRSRPVRVKCLLRRTRSYDMTVFISRAENEDQTHILLVYDPRIEPAAAK